MTAKGPVLIDDSTGIPDPYMGWSGVDFMMSDALSDHLQLAHLFGSDFHSVYPDSAGIADKSTGDQSWNDRHATNAGAVPVAKYFVSGTNSYYLSPLSLDDLIACGTSGDFTMLVVAKFTDTLAMAMGSWNTTVNNGAGFGRQINISGRYHAKLAFASGASDVDTPFILTDGDTGSVYELLGLVGENSALKARLVRQKAGGTLQFSTDTTLTEAIAGAEPICFGRSYPAANYVAAADIVAGFGFSKALNTGELTSFQASLQAFLGTYGITI